MNNHIIYVRSGSSAITMTQAIYYEDNLRYAIEGRRPHEALPKKTYPGQGKESWRRK